MQAILVSEFGGPEVLRPAETGMPRPGPGEVLVRVLAAGVGPWDAGLRRGGCSRLIRMAPWFDDGSLTVTVQARYYWQDAAQAHRAVENGHVQGKLALIVDDDLAAAMEV